MFDDPLLLAANIVATLASALGAFLVSRKEPSRRKWGYVVGLAGQPAWFYIFAVGGNWGLAAVGLWYSYCWASGIYNHFKKGV